MRLIIAGSRNFFDYELLKTKLDHILQHITEPIEIVSGMAKGADYLGEKYAIEKGFPIKHFPADWKGLGKKAGYVRNEQMANYATHCVCFWNGVSSGTKSMIELAKKNGLQLRVIKF